MKNLCFVTIKNNNITIMNKVKISYTDFKTSMEALKDEPVEVKKNELEKRIETSYTYNVNGMEITFDNWYAKKGWKY